MWKLVEMPPEGRAANGIEGVAACGGTRSGVTRVPCEQDDAPAAFHRERQTRPEDGSERLGERCPERRLDVGRRDVDGEDAARREPSGRPRTLPSSRGAAGSRAAACRRRAHEIEGPGRDAPARRGRRTMARRSRAPGVPPNIGEKPATAGSISTSMTCPTRAPWCSRSMPRMVPAPPPRIRTSTGV